MIELTDNPDINTNDYVVARNMAELLTRHYPGHPWAVTVDGKQGIAVVRNMVLDASRGYILKLRELLGDSHMRCVIKAGGEILEAFRQRRGIIRPDHIQSLPTLPNGFPVFDPALLKGRPPSIVTERWARATDPVGFARAKAPKPIAHNDHPLRHYDRTCPGCNPGAPPKIIVETGWNSRRT